LQRYTDAADRDALNPTPSAGDQAYLDDVKSTQVFDGTVWVTLTVGGPYLSLTGGALSGQFLASLGTVAAPGVAFDQSPNGIRSGMFFTAFPTLQLTVAGVEVAEFRVTSTFFPVAGDSSTGIAANAYLRASDGFFAVSTSARKYKTNIESAPQLADLVLNPVTFHRDDDDMDFIGFIADEVAEQDVRAGIFNDDEIENYDLRAVVAILAAKVNRLEAEAARE